MPDPVTTIPGGLSGAETPEEERTGGATYGRLSQKHDDYDQKLIECLEDLYSGGFTIQAKAQRYLVRLEGESGEKFTERARIFSYASFFSQIVDQFVSDVFGQPLSVKPAADADNPNTPGESPDEEFYSEFEKDADRKGTSFVDLMLCTLRCALKHRRALVIVDAPQDSPSAEPAKNVAEEDERGLRRYYAYECPVGRLIDWEVDDETGRFVWCVLYDKERVRTGPAGDRSKWRETWTVWEIGEGGFATWSRYEHTYRANEPPQADTWVRRVSEPKATSFRRIPVLRFELPEGLWVGNKVGPQALEHWNRRSALGGAENRSLVAIPYVKLGPQAPAAGGPIPSDVSQDSSRGDAPLRKFNSKGWMVLDAEDDIGVAEPEGKCYALVDGQLEKLRETMFQVTFQMASSVQRNAASMGRSGLSKKKDEDLTARVLRALGHHVREWAVDVFDVVSEARGDDVHWTPHGLDGYDSEDREALIEETLNLDAIVEALPSETLHKVYARSLAGKLLKNAVDVETEGVILDELEKGISEKREKQELLDQAEHEEKLAGSEARKDGYENPDQGPGQKAPAPVTVPAKPGKVQAGASGPPKN